MNYNTQLGIPNSAHDPVQYDAGQALSSACQPRLTLEQTVVSVRKFFRSIAVLLVWCPSHGAHADAAAQGNPFVVFDALLYQGRPDLSALGMPRIIQMNPPHGAGDEVDDQKTRATMQGIKDYRGVIFLDYEAWPLGGVPAEVVADHVEKYSRVAEIAHETVPKATFGYYGVLPCREYWGLVLADRTKIDAWKECNRQGEAIANHVDVIFPSVYTFYDNQQAWDVYAKGMIAEARRYNKPVYVFLWPEFHPSNLLLRGTNIPAKFWRHQLEFCRASAADGIVIWGGWQEQWKEDAPWWIETKAFLASLQP
jgi:hypothetical protein